MNESIIQDVRAWVLLATSLPAGKVIPVDDPGARPALPYLTVSLVTSDVEVGTDEELYELDDAGALRARVIGDRRATLSLNAYGLQGAELLALCHLSLSQPIVQRFLLAKKLGIQAMTGTQDISALVDTRREKRFIKDFEINYAIELNQVEFELALGQFSMGIELDGDPEFTEPLTVTVEVD